MTKLFCIALTIAFVVAFSGMASALTSENQQKVDTLTTQIAADPSNKDLYAQRSRIYFGAQDFTHAAADLRKSCSLESNADIAELCNLEADEVAQMRQRQ
jgi:uncharacterized protein HemY